MVSHSWFGVKTSDSAVAGHLKEHLRTPQARAHNIKQKKIPLVFRTLGILHSSYSQQRPNLIIYTPPINFMLTTASKGSWLQESPYSTPSINFKQHNSTRPISTEELNPKTSAQSPMSWNEVRSRSFNDDSRSGVPSVTRWHGRGTFG
jgi:hypothetical protein